MDLDEIKELISLMRKNKIKEIDFEQKGSKVRIVAYDPTQQSRTDVYTASTAPVTPYVLGPNGEALAVMPPVAALNPSRKAPAAEEAEVEQAEEMPANTVEVKSPMVGTFYRAPAPDAPPYVELGNVISPGMVVCIIEAMKLMNEIKSDIKGKIVKTLVENGQPVEFNQPLFLVEPL
jgi:acetyl-CoA carboxylase biotin carboxyl carrier protein